MSTISTAKENDILGSALSAPASQHFIEYLFEIETKTKNFLLIMSTDVNQRYQLFFVILFNCQLKFKLKILILSENGFS